MPKCDRPLDESDETVKGRAGERRDRYFAPYHVEPELADLGRDAEAHADDRRAEEFGNDGPDQRQSRVDLEGIENERHGERKPELQERIPIARPIGAHEVAFEI